MMRFVLALLLLFSLCPSPTGADTGASSLHGTLVPVAACEAPDLLSPAIDFKAFQAAAVRHPGEKPTFPQPDPSRSGVQTVITRKSRLIAPVAVDPVPHHCERLPYQPTAPPFPR
jgi:hypothetical protein